MNTYQRKKERRKESSLRLLRLNYIAAKILQKNEALLLKTCVEPKRERQKSKVNLPNGTKSLWVGCNIQFSHKKSAKTPSNHFLPKMLKFCSYKKLKQNLLPRGTQMLFQGQECSFFSETWVFWFLLHAEAKLLFWFDFLLCKNHRLLIFSLFLLYFQEWFPGHWRVYFG